MSSVIVSKRLPASAQVLTAWEKATRSRTVVSTQPTAAMKIVSAGQLPVPAGPDVIQRVAESVAPSWSSMARETRPPGVTALPVIVNRAGVWVVAATWVRLGTGGAVVIGRVSAWAGATSVR